MPHGRQGGVLFVLDPNAIHVNTAAEIVAIAEKVLPVNADLLVIEDSAAGNAKKKVQIGNLPAGGGGGADPNAIHDNIAGEIVLIGEKVVPVAADLVIIEDSADANNKKRVQVGNLPGGTDGAAIHDNVAGEIHAIASKAVPVAADELVIEDSAAAWAKKRMALSTVPIANGADGTAIHDDTAGEIHAIASKAVPVAADELVIEDSAAAWAKKRMALSTMPIANGADGTAIHDDTAGEIHAIASKAVPVAADELVIEDSAAAWAKKRIAISALPAGSGGLGYALALGAWSFNPADSITYYFGMNIRAPDASEGRCKTYIPKAGTLKVAEVFSYAGTTGTDEAWSAYVRLNGATDTLIATISLATATRRWSNTGLSIAVAVGDYFEIKIVSPAWVTNPASISFGGHVYIE